MSGLTCHDCACAESIWTLSNAVLVGKSPLESQRNGETPCNTRSLSGGDLLPYSYLSRSLATKKRTESCSSTPFFGIVFSNCTGRMPTRFSPREISAQSSNALKSLILQRRLQHKPIQSYLSIQGYFDTNERHFQLRRETTPEHKLASFQRLHH